jgi:aldehyde:ferredoxin oxidoreductase
VRRPPTSATSGDEWTGERLPEVGERTIDLERVTNGCFGLDRMDDRLPGRLMRETVELAHGHGAVSDVDVVLDSTTAS